MGTNFKYKVKFLDLRIIDEEERAEYLAAIESVMLSGRFILGPEVTEFESAVAQYCNRRFAIGVGSGTDAIFLALKALGIGNGDQVITSSISWLASGTTIAQTGAQPVFADTNDDLNIDVKSVRKCITSKTKAIMPVHYAGKICDLEALRESAKEFGILLIEDASQAFGARRFNKPAGSQGDVSIFSLNPMKVLSAIGEAGIILCNDKNLLKKLCALRYHGMYDKWRSEELAPNARLDTIQASILLKRLNRVEKTILRRAEIANKYNQALAKYVRTPHESNLPKTRDSWFVYAIRTPTRNALLDYLNANGIEAVLREHIPVPDQPVFSVIKNKSIKNTRRIADELICLPLHEHMNNSDVNTVINTVVSFFNGGRV